MYHDVLLQIVIIYNYALIDWGIVYDYHTHYMFLSSFLSFSSSSSLSSLLFFFLHSFCFFFTNFFLLLFVWILQFFINTYYTYFCKCMLNTVLDKCTWYLTEQNWGIVRTIQIMRYYTYLNVKYGYVNNHATISIGPHLIKRSKNTFW